MTTTKQTSSRIAGWFRAFLDKNRSPYRWYENNGYFGG
jgi:hypothetical protein